MTTESHELALCIINDGDGSQCGYSYMERTLAAARGTEHARVTAGQWVDMAKRMVRWYEREFGGPDDEGRIFSATDILLAAIEVAEYYQEHVKEIDAA